jgi:hypothetical protein
MRTVCPDHADQHVYEQLAFLRRQRFEGPVIGCGYAGAQAPMQLFAFWCEMEEASATIGSIHALLDQSVCRQLFDQQAYVRALDTHPCRETVLVDPRLAILPVEEGYDTVLQRRQVGGDEAVRLQRQANLVEAPR